MDVKDLSDIWRNVEGSGPLPKEQLRFLDIGEELNGHAVLAGLDALGHRHLCIPTTATDEGKANAESRGVSLGVRELLDPHKREVLFVDLECKKPELNPLFEAVAVDVLEACRKQPGSAFGAAAAALARWRDLLEPESDAILGIKELAALFAELTFLLKLANGSSPPLACWKGPLKSPHDFVCGEVDYEVKSTLSNSGREIEVNGLDQLRPAPAKRLYLWWVRLRPASGQAATVPQLVAQLVELGAHSKQLAELLSKVGFHLRDQKQYDQVRFEIMDEAMYAVDDQFPRLTLDSLTGKLPPQVTRLTYWLNLATTDPAPLSTAAAQKIVQTRWWK